MENRNGMCVDLSIAPCDGRAEALICETAAESNTDWERTRATTCASSPASGMLA